MKPTNRLSRLLSEARNVSEMTYLDARTQYLDRYLAKSPQAKTLFHNVEKAASQVYKMSAELNQDEEKLFKAVEALEQDIKKSRFPVDYTVGTLWTLIQELRDNHHEMGHRINWMRQVLDSKEIDAV